MKKILSTGIVLLLFSFPVLSYSLNRIDVAGDIFNDLIHQTDGNSNWILLKNDSFEYEKIFDFPKKWWKQSSFDELEWYLEGPTKNAYTTTERASTGLRSAKVSNEPSQRGVIVAPCFEFWHATKKCIEFYFYLPEGNFENWWDGIYIDVDTWDYSQRTVKIGIVGFNRFGLVQYIYGYAWDTDNLNDYNVKYVESDFELECNKWYRASLYVDFEKFVLVDPQEPVSPDVPLGITFELEAENSNYTFNLPLTHWTDNWIGYQFSVAGYYCGISIGVEERFAYFDDVKSFVGAPLAVIEKPKENCLYIFDKEIMPVIFGNTIIIGEITVEINAYDEDDIDRVEFYIDDFLESNDTEYPYEWTWDEKSIGRHELRVIAYDNEGNKAEDKINVVIFNLGR